MIQLMETVIFQPTHPVKATQLKIKKMNAAAWEGNASQEPRFATYAQKDVLHKLEDY